MLAIRLARTGKKHQAYFRIVVSDSRKQPTAKFVEILGNYNPHAKEFKINEERLAYYLKNGAQPSDSVAKLLIREKIELPKWVKVTEKKKAPKKAVEEKPEVKEEAPKAEEAAEASEESAAESTEEVKEEVSEVSEEVTEEAKPEETEATEEAK